MLKEKISIIKYYLTNLSIIKFIYFNFISRNIVREKGKYVIIYKHVVLDLDKSARIYIYNKSLEIGVSNLKSAKTETHLRMEKNSRWISHNGAGVIYNTVLEIKENAIFETGYFTANGGCAIVCAKKIVFGDNVMLGRNVIIYDSDFHQMLDTSGKMKNPPKEVIIEKDVWLTSNITVLKGVKIGEGSIGAAYTTVIKDIPAFSIFGGKSVARILGNDAKWSRKLVKYGDDEK